MLRHGWIRSLGKTLCQKTPSKCDCGNSMMLFSRNSLFIKPGLPALSATHAHYPTLSSFSYSTSTLKGVNTKDDAALQTLTPEEISNILKVVNEVNQAEDLLKYIIPKKKAEEVIKCKNESSDKVISSLNQLISIVGVKSSSKFFCSVLNKPIPVSSNSAMFPILTSEETNSISKVMSLIIVGDKVSWCLAQRRLVGKKSNQLTVESINQVDYVFKPRMHFLALLKEMENVVNQLPKSELYIVEEYPVTVPTPYMFNFHLQMGQAKSTVVGLLSSRSTESKIISLKTVAVGRLFNTYIGSEKVSGQHLVEDIFDSQTRLPFLDVPELIIQNYNTVDAKVKEGLSQALLLNFAYWKLTKQFDVSG